MEPQRLHRREWATQVRTRDDEQEGDLEDELDLEDYDSSQHDKSQYYPLLRREAASAQHRSSRKLSHQAVRQGPVERPVLGQHLIDEVAKRLKQSELRVIRADRQAKALEGEASKLRIALKEAQLALEHESNKRQEEEKTLKMELERAREQASGARDDLNETKRKLATAKRELERIQTERDEKASALRDEQERLDNQVRIERSNFQQLKLQVVALQDELDQEKRVASRRLQEVNQALSTEVQKVSELTAQLRSTTTDKETLEQELAQVTQQKNELSTLLAAARQADIEARQGATQVESRVKRLESSLQRSKEENQQLAAQLTTVYRALDDEKDAHEQIVNKLERTRSEVYQLEQQLLRLTERRSHGQQQMEDARRQVEDAKDVARQMAERLREAENKLRGEHELAMSRAEHENQLLQLDLEKAKQELASLASTRRAAEAAVQTARAELEQARHDAAENAATAARLVEQAREAEQARAYALGLERELEDLRRTNQAAAGRLQRFRQDIEVKQQEVNRLARLCKDFERRLVDSMAQAQDQSERHKATLKAKEAENTYVWNKLEHALQLH